MKAWTRSKRKKENQLELFFPENIPNEKLPYYNKKTGMFSKKNNPVSVATTRALTPISNFDDIIYNHSVFCQVFLPYSKLPEHQLTYERKNGTTHLILQSLKDADMGEAPGLPYGNKSRLLLMYINNYATQRQSKLIDVMNSLNDFMVKHLEIDNNGRNYKLIKDHLTRIRQTSIHISYHNNTGHRIHNSNIIKDYQLTKNGDCYIQLSEEYYNSLIKHSVPLDQIAISALSYNSMALDIYSWLAHRLHRIEKSHQFVPFQSLKEQFGHNYATMYHFKEKFRKNLNLALMVYHAANGKVSEIKNKGITLRPCRPPIDKKIYTIDK